MVTHLYIYPIKSLGAVSLSETVMEKEGLRGDRRFMLVDATGKFITQRTRPELTRFVLCESAQGFIVKDTASGLEKELTWEPTLGEWIPVEIWEDQLPAQEVLEGWSEWFSTALSEEVRLVRISSEKPRVMKAKYQTEIAKNTSFADSLPLLLVSAGSYAALQAHVEEPINQLRFRPNIIVSSPEPFVEDTWVELNIGEVSLSGAKPCARCSLVNVDPLTGESDKVTLKALASFRTLNHKVYFGQQFVPMSVGKIQVGMEVQVIQSKDAFY
ncbi:MOSC domain-containing protein [Aquirufa lenticrescens]|uniref:MOSC domain-containing protein n=1 Tax=Aquirufa lenticrescens TaxID=2696560 RepID=UPI001CAA4B75|nr:MOSC N-terminal beta barrel domain-containing protein [Aquirufa lenticrescens]UAJ14593.1 MOSC domain-containing protein [Aquirufa lenticrescens]